MIKTKLCTFHVGAIFLLLFGFITILKKSLDSFIKEDYM